MDTNKLIEKAKSMGAEKATEFSIDDIVFDERTLLKCLYGCTGNYHYCPRVDDSVTVKDYIEMTKKYKVGVLICTDNLKDGQKIALELERIAFLDGHHFAFAATECAICPTCSRIDDKPCRSPKSKRIPLYALGIDVYNTVRNIGWTLNVVQDEDTTRKNITAVFVE